MPLELAELLLELLLLEELLLAELLLEELLLPVAEPPQAVTINRPNTISPVAIDFEKSKQIDLFINDSDAKPI